VSGAIILLKQMFLIRYIARQNVESKLQKKKLLYGMLPQEGLDKIESLEPAKTAGLDYLFITMTSFARAA
jgi:hypothetical protein